VSGSIGTLRAGAAADAVIFEMEEGEFTFTDSFRTSEIGSSRLVPKIVIRGGNTYLAGTWNDAGWVHYKPTWV